MSVAPTDEEEIEALAQQIMTLLERTPRPLSFHASAVAVVVATLAVSCGQWKEMLRFINDTARQIVVNRRKGPLT